MKCQNCGQEMRFGQEQFGTDTTGNPLYKDFAYCDNCGNKVEIQQAQSIQQPLQQQNSGSYDARVQTNNPPKKKHGCLWSIIVFFLICGLLSQCSDPDDSANNSKKDTSVSSEATATSKAKKNADDSKSKNKKKTNNKTKAKPTKKAKKTAKPKPTLSPKQIKAKEKKEAKSAKASFISKCKEYNYKKVMRNPNKYIGKKIKLKCQIKQISEDGWLTQGFLRCYSYSGYNIYAENEYVVFDERLSKSPKLLTDDVITVYGTIEEPEKMTRALTGTKDTVFSINMKYVKIHNK